MIIKYKIYSYSTKIDRVEILKETAHFVTLPKHGRERREAKAEYFDSWAEAHAVLLARYANKVEYAQRELEGAKAKLYEVESMTPVEKQKGD